MLKHELALDMRKQRTRERATVRRGETGTQMVAATLTDCGEAYEPTGTARLRILHADGTWCVQDAEVEGATVSAVLSDAAVNGVGRCRLAYFEFDDGGDVATTQGFELVIEADIDAPEPHGGESGTDDEGNRA